MATESVSVKDVESAIQVIARAESVSKIIAEFIQSGNFDAGRYSYDIGESVAMVADCLGAAFRTLNEGRALIRG